MSLDRKEANIIAYARYLAHVLTYFLIVIIPFAVFVLEPLGVVVIGWQMLLALYGLAVFCAIVGQRPWLILVATLGGFAALVTVYVVIETLWH